MTSPFAWSARSSSTGGSGKGFVKSGIKRWLPAGLGTYVRRTKRSLQRARFRSPRQLDFVIIGAEKAGTSLLQEVLRNAAGVYMPEGEVRYFRDPFFGNPEILDEALGGAHTAQLTGIKHPSYLGVEEAAERLFRHNRNLKLVVSLRDPVDRAVSAYYHYLAHGQVAPREPDEAFSLILSENRSCEPKYEHIYQFSRYHTHLQRYLELFDPRQILLLEFEQLNRDRSSWERLFRFLELPDCPPSQIPAINPGTYTWKACLRRHFHSRLTTVYDESMNKIASSPEAMISPGRAVEVFDSMLTTLRSIDAEPGESAETIRRLVEVYQVEVDRLRQSGWFSPKNWRHYPRDHAGR